MTRRLEISTADCWTCPFCGALNATGRRECGACGAGRESRGNGPGTQNATQPDTDTGAEGKRAPRAVPGAKMTATEARYRRDILEPRLDGFDLREIRRPGLALYTPGGHRYTPDFVCVRMNCDRLEIHEVKGAYRLGSYQRARVVFDECRKAWPQYIYYWATWTGKKWVVE